MPSHAPIWTVGHSTRSAEEFLALLLAHDIRAIADVRRFPGSRRHPHFSREQLSAFLVRHDVEYVWMPELGGRRTPLPDSHNTGWRVAQFRGYADYMETPEFIDAIAKLLDLASRARTAVMCAESLWWQCHRRLIADYLLARGHDVIHIESATKASPHKFVPPARIVGGSLSYAAEQLDL
jgi:uncharacterized protein (DUF488 family)